jgi:phosphoribosylaminoimidazolecarboxamide formyltransferase / IMP cyclohydrolase
LTTRRRALISVSDKTGLSRLAKELTALGFEIVSTGGTAGALKEAGIEVTEASEVTGYPEILGGRVKTLHPHIHGAILARLDSEEQKHELDRLGIVPIELVIVNLYPFEETIAREGTSHDQAIEKIDVGGPTMLRAAAKNHEHVTVVVNPERYAEILVELKEKGVIGDITRCRLAAEAFAHTAAYDAAIAGYLNSYPGAGVELYPGQLSIGMRKVQNLRYGENPQQEAAFYTLSGPPQGLAAARQLQGKELSFNNLNDLHAAWELVLEFTAPTAVAVKHANPCGVGSAPAIDEAYRLAFEADPISIFGGVVALNRSLDAETAREMSKIFLEVVAAPGFEEEALAILQAKKDIRLLQMDLKATGRNERDLKKIAGGILIQTVDRDPVAIEKGRVVTKRAPTPEEWEQMVFAQTVVKHVRSNAIVIAGRGQTYGIGAGQTSRIGATRIALAHAGSRADGAALGSDAFFPFPDSVEEAAIAGITAIVQPGGSMKDQEVIDACNRLGLAMVFTGRRYFKH